MRFKKFFTFTLSVAMCLGLVACGSSNQMSTSGDVDNQTITLAESWDFSTSFYPVLGSFNATNYGATYWNKNFYNTLLSYDENGDLQGELAQTYEVSEDGLQYTFILRKDVKFSDGTAVTADAVKQSIDAAITNLGEYKGAYGNLISKIVSTEAVDEHTFVMKLQTPCYSALNDLTMSTPLAIVNPKAFEGGVGKAYEHCSNATMGSGAYMFERFEDNTYTFVKNPHYWGEEPEVDTFKVKVIEDNDAKVLALRNGEIDAIIGSSRANYDAFGELAKEGTYSTKVFEQSTLSRYLGMNLSNEPFSDEDVRKAVAYAINQQELDKSVFGGIESAAETFFPKDKPYCDVEQTEYETNIAKANELMDKSGYIDSNGDGIREKDGRALEITLKYAKNLTSIDDAALAIAAQLKEIGIKVTPVAKDMMAWYGEIMGGDYTTALWYTYGGAFDPTTVMTNLNPAISADPIVVQYAPFIEEGNALVVELDNTPSAERVQEIYSIILKNIAEKNLAVPLTYAHEIAVWNTMAIADYTFYHDAQYVNVAGIDFK